LVLSIANEYEKNTSEEDWRKEIPKIWNIKL
jgi:hypothetical protein